MIDALISDHVLITGIEDDPETDLLRLYIGPKRDCHFVLTDEKERVRSVWAESMGVLTLPRPEKFYCASPSHDHSAES